MSDQTRSRPFPWAASVLALFALAIAGYAVSFYLLGNPLATGFMEGKKASQGFQPSPGWTLALVIHAAGGSLALVTGAVQWLLVGRRKTRSQVTLHRSLGIAYALSILAAGAAGLVMAPVAMGGPWAVAGFLILDLAWLGATGRAAFLGWTLGRAGSGNTRTLHRAWMVRSFSLTAAAITLRLWIPLLSLTGLGFLSAYTVIAWLCWVPNLFVAEVLIRRSRTRHA